ncbi:MULTISPECIES: sigma-70 family RNA polymerase sigma factor [Halomonas]|uniref:sigma-70 family RNA polymerase sigma factor n=1 Tax=Halomonas TaxID=2745 RepID=UPI001C99A758|nr:MULTISPECIES: sigma-70 family RNA polymerase sigma factor [Halomonas]MBY5970604.1 sigma-70 family RNA polymerase sigma factor [Halomonas denitrificans]MBY5984370.1 sigma-70 family RNA polymerase sigma factor [Halomonas sp. DP5Y7-2]
MTHVQRLETDTSAPSDAQSPQDRLVMLLARVEKGDREAFAELYQATSAKLFGTVLRILKDTTWADDVIQDVYVTIWQKADRFDQQRGSVIGWMATIARNAAIDDLRRAPRHQSEDDSHLENAAATQASAFEQRDQDESSDRLSQCLEELEETRSQMVRLAYLDGWSRADLATHFGQPVNTVKTWLHRALKQLKGCLST